LKETLKAGRFSLTFDDSTGTYSLSEKGVKATVFEGATACVNIPGRKTKIITSDPGQRSITSSGNSMTLLYRPSEYPLTISLHASAPEETEAFIIRMVVNLEGSGIPAGTEYYPLLLERATGASLFGRHREACGFRFLRNGLLTWSISGVLRSDQKLKGSPLKIVHDATENAGIGFPEGQGHFIGEWFGAVKDDESGRMLVAGFTSTARRLGQISFKSSSGYFRHLYAISRDENAEPGEGETAEIEPLAIIPLPRKDSAKPMSFDGPLKLFAGLTAIETPPPRLPENPVGWCSWYYYFHDLSENTILENIEAAKRLRDRIPIEYIQVDDGYQPAPGDWLETTKKFPRGMKWLAGRIRDAGFRPGIWLAPFMATNRSRLFRNHRSWFVHKPGGVPRWITLWPSPYAFGVKYGLDTTHPEALRWLRKTFRTIVHRWGYEYLKLDFLYAGAIDGVRFDRSATRAGAFRRGLEAIREAAGDETYILGCGVPLGPAMGLVNGARISGDTAPYWHSTIQSELLGHATAPGVPNAARVMFSRYFMHRSFWLSDPDCLMSRFSNTKLGGDEVLTHAACVALTGGPLVISDRLGELTEDSIRLIQQLIPPVDTPAVPADLFDNSIPSMLVMPFRRDYDEVTVVGRFNWGSHACDLPLDFETAGLNPGRRYHVYDLWEDRYYGVQTKRVTLPRIPRHASRMLSLRTVRETPHVIATTFHFTQGGIDMKAQEYDSANRRLRFKICSPGSRKGRIYLHIPLKYEPEHARVNGRHETMPIREQGCFYYLDIRMLDSAEVEIRFK